MCSEDRQFDPDLREITEDGDGFSVTWIREDGKEFHGEMLTPAIWSDTLEAAQAEYEKADRIIRTLIQGGEGE